MINISHLKEEAALVSTAASNMSLGPTSMWVLLSGLLTDLYYNPIKLLCVLTVNSVCWAPQDYGLILACGSSDGAISLLSYTGDGQWEVKKISNAHTVSIYSFCNTS